jgi:hypothetical protein
MQMVAMVCIQLEKGTPKEKIHESFDFDDEFDVGMQFYVEFAIENNFVLRDELSGEYRITESGREFIDAFLPDVNTA